jgi:hypothetical protein
MNAVSSNSSFSKRILANEATDELSVQDLTKIPDRITIDVNHNYFEQVTNLLPGVGFMQKGCNPLSGIPLFEGGQVDTEMFELTYEKGRTTSGDIGYLVPDQMNIPVLAFMCEKSSMTSEVTTAMSMQSMVAASQSSSFSKEISASVEVEGYGAKASGSMEKAISSSHSSAFQKDQEMSKSGHTSKFSTTALASLFTYSYQKDNYHFTEKFMEEASKVNNDATTFEFVKTYGTHFVSRAKMGSRFEQSYYFSEKASTKDISEAKQMASADSLSFSKSASVEGGGFGFSGSASASSKKSKSSEKAKESSNSRGHSFMSNMSTSGSSLSGMVNASGTECGEIVGEQNILFPVQYETVPLWEIQSLPTNLGDRLENFYSSVLKEAGKCGIKKCK